MRRITVVPVSFESRAPPATAMVDEALALFARWSDGLFRTEAWVLPPLAVAEPARHFTALGGMTRLGGPLLAARARAPGPLLLVADGPFHPHCWRLPAEAGGGAYALLPASAPAMTAAHEIGHLLLGWRDAPGAGRHCLMGAGLDPPGAWLRVASSWTVPWAITATDTVGELGRIGTWDGLVVERADNALLAWSAADRVARVGIGAADQDRPILALLAAQGVHPEALNTRSRELSQ